MARKTHLCIICGENTPGYKHIAHRNKRIAEGFVFCSECVIKYANEDETPHDILRMLNIPYVNSIWKDSLAKSSESPMSEYLKMIAPQKRRYSTYQDSVFDEGSGDFQVTDEIIGRWGTLDNKNDYIDLELAYQDLKQLKPPSTPIEDRQYIETVRLGQRYRSDIDEGKATEVKNLRQAYMDSLKDIGLDSNTLNNKDSEIGIGTHIQKFENTEPLPELAPEFQDVDRILQYIRVLFTNSMKRAHGKATENEIAELHNLKKSIIPRKGRVVYDKK